MLSRRSLLTLALVTCVLALPGVAQAQLTQIAASGANAAAIQGVVDFFRFQVSQGGVNNGVGGSFPNGRREINWDGVPAAFSAPNNLPFNFFNVNSPRGAIFATPGTGFMVSDNAVGTPNSNGVGVRFDNLNATYSATFPQVFSQQKLFTALGSNVMDVTFFLPGTGISGTVAGFGVVFADVDLPTSTFVQFFDRDNQLLASIAAPAANEGLSFVGAYASDLSSRPVNSVRIVSGAAGPGPNDLSFDGSFDIVVMDDFIYGEPTAIPEPASLSLLGAGAVYAYGRNRRRRKVGAKKDANEQPASTSVAAPRQQSRTPRQAGHTSGRGFRVIFRRRRDR